MVHLSIINAMSKYLSPQFPSPPSPLSFSPLPLHRARARLQRILTSPLFLQEDGLPAGKSAGCVDWGKRQGTDGRRRLMLPETREYLRYTGVRSTNAGERTSASPSQTLRPVNVRRCDLLAVTREG